MRELDFRREMRNLQQFRRNFAADQTVAFPKPYPDLSTGRVLTMQLLEGTSVGDTGADLSTGTLTAKRWPARAPVFSCR